MSEDEELVCLKLGSKDGLKEYNVSIRRMAPRGKLVEPALRLMVNYFIPRETMNSHLGFTSDEANTIGLVEGWRSKIAFGNTLAAVLAESYADDKEPVLLGANITYVVNNNYDDFDISVGGYALKTIGDVLKHIDEECDICKTFNVQSYLSAMGLGVDPQYHGLGVGLELLKAREILCKRIGLTCSATVFTGHISQHLATKAGFNTVYCIKYNDVVVKGEHVFAKAESDLYLKLMARTYTH